MKSWTFWDWQSYLPFSPTATRGTMWARIWFKARTPPTKDTTAGRKCMLPLNLVIVFLLSPENDKAHLYHNSKHPFNRATLIRAYLDRVWMQEDPQNHALIQTWDQYRRSLRLHSQSLLRGTCRKMWSRWFLYLNAWYGPAFLGYLLKGKGHHVITKDKKGFVKLSLLQDLKDGTKISLLYNHSQFSPISDSIATLQFLQEQQETTEWKPFKATSLGKKENNNHLKNRLKTTIPQY